MVLVLVVVGVSVCAPKSVDTKPSVVVAMAVGSEEQGWMTSFRALWKSAFV